MLTENFKNFNNLLETRKVEQRRHEEILLEKLEIGGNCDLFDGSTLELLGKILQDTEEKGLMRLKVFNNVINWIVPKMAGVGTGAVAMDEGSKYAAEIAKGYLREKMLLEVGSKNVPMPSKAVETITQQVTQTDFFGTLRDTVNSIANTAQAALVHATEKVQEGGAMAVNYASETFINNIAGPTTEMLSKPPLAVGAFLLGAGIVGGGLSMIHTMRERSGFGLIDNLIQKSYEFIENGKISEDSHDPRLDLIAYFKNVSEDPKHLGHKLSQEEWLIFAGSVRAARASVLHDMTQAPRIVVGEEVKEGINRQEKIVEDIVSNQQALAESDIALATEILSQFGEHLGKDIDPIKQKLKYDNNLLPKISLYSKVFIRGGFDATGIPMAWRIATFGFKSAHKAARVATFGAIP
ncbi:hypothetical protein A2641_02895 [Candidatus Nomurabacteria bacterium RIFCSPHIGHO2_01_FULL_37_25]|uniref:Uncharacterized protein n=1 Tax=Candidatus Nomurabacteria bacterium RIFCSPLOWO2_01_FULL_36_16 TaxID=1801767 RepID=A0A1F6X0C0_9BACT|nr:MAG: hypothetical protein A2641_02895 [Candidatus Nomurabacteria bacterium RIFCSPHIGHO2_01_FULL_37_25]OGI75095.1 MAG: hypothetical protein A3D36_03640 [Candidatus Nomurabacteria bacterium RIFCSPHIGHO2_02_FULL_36_29]OGI87606.1 MAG: hypothetical protein A3A91_01715 [Candidatus Nomurabacteria bacterium RIFCSPLOWO2_01_FULL_36_16]OGI97265.1 MAG: hypothetical protein A3I84_01430 [Candidatus Nomurabacteria bacterium RIFCSPLOWO2_02_FULL_36_8]